MKSFAVPIAIIIGLFVASFDFEEFSHYDGRSIVRIANSQTSFAEQSRAEQSRAEQSRAEQSRAEQSRAEQSRAEYSPSSAAARTTCRFAHQKESKRPCKQFIFRALSDPGMVIQFSIPGLFFLNL